MKKFLAALLWLAMAAAVFAHPFSQSEQAAIDAEESTISSAQDHNDQLWADINTWQDYIEEEESKPNPDWFQILVWEVDIDIAYDNISENNDDIVDAVEAINAVHASHNASH